MSNRRAIVRRISCLRLQARNGAAYWQHGMEPTFAGSNDACQSAGVRGALCPPARSGRRSMCRRGDRPGGYGAACRQHGMWCRRNGAAYRRHGIRRHDSGGGVAGPCGDAARTPKGVLFPGRWGVLFPGRWGVLCFRHGVRCRLWPARRLAGPGGIRPGGTVPAGTVPGITAPGMVPPSMVPPDIVPPIGGTILGGTVSGGTVSGRHGIGPAGDGAGNGRHDIPAAVGHPPPPWGRRHAAPPSALPWPGG